MTWFKIEFLKIRIPINSNKKKVTLTSIIFLLLFKVEGFMKGCFVEQKYKIV